MARSALFARLRSMAARVRRERGLGERDMEPVRITRRDLLAASAAAAAAGLVCCELGGRGAADQRVAIIGAGLAGLHCAYRLQQAGVAVTLYEASDRVGGRTWTARDAFPDAQVAELGGELIDSNHRFMHALAKELGLTLDDRLADLPEGCAVDTWFVAGKRVPEDTIVAQFGKVAAAMLADMQAADADDREYERLDRTPLSDWLATRVPPASYPELHAILTSAYRGEFGLQCEQQSALNLIYLIGSNEPDPFRIFGDSDERYHVHGGNDRIARALAERIAGVIEHDARLVAAADDDDGFQLSFTRKQGRDFAVRAVRVVFALPYSTLREVDLAALTLSGGKRRIIAELGYGTNAKVMGSFTSRIWRDAHHASGSVTSDLPFQQTWDSSIGQPGDHGLLTNFLGGEQGLQCKDGSADAWFQRILPDLDRVYPGIAQRYVAGSAVRMHWPSYAHTRGSYTCYRPGQWSFWGKEGQREGKLHFCGEHTSAEFQGWMEGAAETGGHVAAEILNELERPLPKELAALLHDEASAEHALRLPFPRRFLRVRLG